MSTDCAVRPAISARPRTVSVNGTVIAREAIARETQHHPASKPIEAWRAAARALVIRELLLQEARQRGLGAKPLTDDAGRRETDEEALIRAVIDADVELPEPDEATCRRYYDANRARFRSADLVEASHILLPAAPDDGERRSACREQAERLMAELKERPEDFAALAKLHSACPSREVGGSLGQIGRGQTVPEFERQIALAPIGAVSPDVVESRFGVHVLRVDRREPGRELPFDLVRERIAEYLGERVRRTALRQYVAILAGRAAIVGVDFEASPSPLVQ
jgi:peptidyl-prolyl cis-trans isomerase C